VATDPYKYFRVEARELLDVLQRGAREILLGRGGRELVASLLRAAHTLKGAARVVRRPEIADLAHSVEDALAPHRETGAPPAARAEEILALAAAAESRLAELCALGPATPSSSAKATATATATASGDDLAPETPSSPDRFRTVRVEAVDLERLSTGLQQTETELRALREALPELERERNLARDVAESLAGASGGGLRRVAVLAAELRDVADRRRRRLDEALERTEREAADARERADALRLRPVDALFAALERAADDAARAAGKRVSFRAAGGGARLDADVLALVEAAMVQLVRNAVAHGVESETARIAAGKPPVGAIEVRAARAGGRLLFTCSDDGAGVDVEAVRRAVARRGASTPGGRGALDAATTAELLLRGGVSTSGATTELAGRGVGLDVVRDAVARLNGETSVRTEAGRGTTFELGVPFALASAPALLAEAGGVVCGFPADAVRRAVRLGEGDVARSADGATIVEGDAVVPYARLGDLLGVPAKARGPRVRTAVVVHAEGRTAAIGVDRLLGASNLLMKPLPPWVEADPIVAGGALGPHGEPRWMLDPAALTLAARSARPTEAPARERPLPVLVVDDSLTTRMLERSILESAGYEVETAVSGEEALEKARARRFGLLLADVEMPGMDGFELLTRARQEPSLRDVPAVLVTSRGSPEDRKRGFDVGARAYVVKSEFDQGRLLALLRETLGTP
jgi:two-component system, chemotaxis family, sensor kinase CheA